MLDPVEAQIQARKMYKAFESFDVRYNIVVEIQFSQRGAQGAGEFDPRDLVLPETQFLSEGACQFETRHLEFRSRARHHTSALVKRSSRSAGKEVIRQ